MELQYHQATFRLLQCEPVVSQRAVKRLDDLESTIGVPLPESIREWYSLEGAAKRLAIDDDFNFLEEVSLEQHIESLKVVAPRDEYWWILQAFSSGVCYACQFPTASDPIVRWIETDGSFFDTITGNRPFSAFAFDCCWFKCHERAKFCRSGNVRSFKLEKVNLLSEFYFEGPHILRGDIPNPSKNPFTGELQSFHRFWFYYLSPLGTIHFRSIDDPRESATEAIWEVCSDDESNLKKLVSQLKKQKILPRR